MKNLVHGDKKTVSNTILAIIFLAAVSSYLGIDWGQPASAEPTPIQEASVPQKTKEEVIADASLQVVELGAELYKQGKENKEKKREEYHANRGERWVYQVGEIASDEDLLYDHYVRLKDSIPVAIFKKSRKEYLLFINVASEPGKIELLDSIDNNPDYFNALNPHIKVIDLKAFCDFKKPKMKIDGTLKVSKRKHKDSFRVDCFVCD
ncbi:MAG: hypothetical protein WBG62_02535 [Cyclobacteriaceae bacterium]